MDFRCYRCVASVASVASGCVDLGMRLLPLCKWVVVVVRLVASGATPEGWFAATCKRSFLAFYCDINLNLIWQYSVKGVVGNITNPYLF